MIHDSSSGSKNKMVHIYTELQLTAYLTNMMWEQTMLLFLINGKVTQEKPLRHIYIYIYIYIPESIVESLGPHQSARTHFLG